jgi:SAM-dependent methyltransferase
MSIYCNVCGSPMREPEYSSGAGASLTSLCRIVFVPTTVRVCVECSHVQTDEVIDTVKYYDKDYDILLESEEDDQIYDVVNGTPLFRTQHQIEVLQRKMNFAAGDKLLDYGCAKSSTYKALSKARSDLVLHLFDVSDRYVPFWSDFIGADHWATYTPRADWKNYFDVVTSFFAFEHIGEPVTALLTVKDLLRNGGRFYCIVPNVFTNVADFIVVDHLNHFTPASIAHMFKAAGFCNVEIDETSHRGAFIIIAEKSERQGVATYDVAEIPAFIETAEDLGVFWSGIAVNVRAFEATVGRAEKLAVYGAGFYGAFIAATLKEPDRIQCFLDQNPHLVGRTINGKPVLHPIDVPKDISTLMVGLNPANAKNIIAQVPTLASLNKFFI